MLAKTTVSRLFNHPAAEIWETVEDFGDYRWGEGVGEAEVDGATDVAGTIRSFAYYGQPSRQRLVAHDPKTYSMSWESVEAFDPTLAYYRAILKVVPVTMSGQSLVEWSVEFDATPEAVDQWRQHQLVEFEKSLERLDMYTNWRLKGWLD